MASCLDSDGGGFSIREYAASMRGSAESGCRLLGVEQPPPMPVKKFRWWADELAAAARSPAPRSGKPRAPKKRSISELFAAAPPAKSEEKIAPGEEEDVEMDEVLCKIKSKAKKKKRSEEKSKKQIEGGGGDCDAIGFARKVITPDKIKMPDPLDTPHTSKKSEGNKQLKNQKEKIPDIKRSKPEKVKNLRTKHKLKYIRSTKVKRKPQDLGKMLPLHSILKKWTKRTSVKMVKEKCSNSNGADVIELCHESVKRVTFSGVDDILDNRKQSSSMKLPQLQSLCKLFSDVLASSSSSTDMSSEGDRCASATEESQVMNASGKSVAADSTVDRHDEACIETKQSSHNTSEDSSETSSMKSPAGLIDLNHALSETTDLNYPYVSDPEMTNLEHTKDANSDFDVQILGDGRESDLKHRHDYSPEAKMDACSPGLTCEPNASDMERIMDSKSAGTSLSGQESKDSDGEIVGLPLNSRGEFVKFHSDLQKSSVGLAVADHVEPRKSNTTMKGKSPCTLPHHTNQYSTQSLWHCQPDLNFAGFQFSARGQVPYCRCSECNQSHTNKPKFHSDMNLEHEFRSCPGQTMRLMGKDLTVGANRSECSNAEVPQTDVKTAESSLNTKMFLQLPQQEHPFLSLQAQSFYNVSANATSTSQAHFGYRPQHLCNHPFPGEILVRPDSTVDVFLGNRTLHENSFRDLPSLQRGRNVSSRFPSFPDHDSARFSQNSLAPNCYSGPFARSHPRMAPVNNFPFLPTFTPYVTPSSVYRANLPPLHGVCTASSAVHPLPKGLDNGYSARKRPPDEHGRFSEAPKKPDPKMRGHSDSPTDVDLPLRNTDKEAARVLGNSSTSANVQCVPRSGPVKLSAGAKHILKPSQNTEEGNSPPVYSCIPFVVGNIGGSVSACQDKAAEVYKF